MLTTIIILSILGFVLLALSAYLLLALRSAWLSSDRWKAHYERIVDEKAEPDKKCLRFKTLKDLDTFVKTYAHVGGIQTAIKYERSYTKQEMVQYYRNQCWGQREITADTLIDGKPIKAEPASLIYCAKMPEESYDWLLKTHTEGEFKDFVGAL